MSKIKLALCAPASQVNDPSVSSADWTLSLHDRAVVDAKDNTDTSLQQLLPYAVIVKRKRTISGVTNSILGYQRPGKTINQGELKLAGKNSIGFGGHPDSLPSAGDDLVTHLALETFRELFEELGFRAKIDKLIGIIGNALQQRAFIQLTDTSVDTLHTGIAVIYVLDEDEEVPLDTPQATEVEALAWLSAADVLANQEDFDKYEFWSKYLLGHLASVTYGFEPTQPALLELAHVDHYKALLLKVFPDVEHDVGTVFSALHNAQEYVELYAAVKHATVKNPVLILDENESDTVFKEFCAGDVFKFRALVGAAGWSNFQVLGDQIALIANFVKFDKKAYDQQVLAQHARALATQAPAAQ